MENETKTRINKILKNKLVKESSDYLMIMIPELSNMVGFDHNHPEHHLDVWNHTLLTLDNLDTDDIEINMAALLHDIGKPFSYQDKIVRHFKGHAEVSANMAFLILQRLHYDAKFIEDVCYLIETHDLVIDVSQLDNTVEMIEKRLQLQYADAKAHHPNKVSKRIAKLDKIKNELQSRKDKTKTR